MHPNYSFVAGQCVLLTANRPNCKILDYGCGSGEIVDAGRHLGLEMYGVEAFYEGGNSKAEIIAGGKFGTIIKEMDGDRIPFPDRHFDVVVANQVFEHVSNLGVALGEIARVLKPCGFLLCLFPSREVIREGHCGIPLIHWFRKDSAARYPWILFFRKLGFGAHTGGRTPEDWSRNFLSWLDRFTFYRSLNDIRPLFDQIFETTEHLEEEYISYRLALSGHGGLAWLAKHWPAKYASRIACRRLGGLVMLSKRS